MIVKENQKLNPALTFLQRLLVQIQKKKRKSILKIYSEFSSSPSSGFQKEKRATLLKLFTPIYNFQKLGLIPKFQVDFPKIIGPTLCLGHDLRMVSRHETLVWSVKYVETSGNCSQRFFTLFLQLLSCDLMFSVTTCFFSCI